MEYTGPPMLAFYVIAVLALCIIALFFLITSIYSNWAKDTRELNATIGRKQRRIDLLEEIIDMSPHHSSATHEVPTVALMKNTRIKKNRDHG